MQHTDTPAHTTQGYAGTLLLNRIWAKNCFFFSCFWAIKMRLTFIDFNYKGQQDEEQDENKSNKNKKEKENKNNSCHEL